jgi:hypothetical protein
MFGDPKERKEDEDKGNGFTNYEDKANNFT